MSAGPGQHADLDAGRVVVLLTGAPGAGKTTLAGLLAAALTRSAVVDGYAVSTMVRQGRVWALGEPADEAARQVELCHRNLCTLATSFAEAGFSSFVDTVVADGSALTTFRDRLGDRLRLVVLDPGTEACVRRNAERAPEERFAFDGYDDLRVAMHTGYGGLCWWVDTSGQTAEQTAELLLADLDVRGRVGAT